MAPETGETVPLSEQHLVDCTLDYENSGCDGGRPENAFLYVMKEGIASDKSYSYKNKVRISRSCTLTKLLINHPKVKPTQRMAGFD